MQGRREEIDRLLRNGAVVVNPRPELLALARSLGAIDLIEVSDREFVKCANPEDRDFPPYNRHCRGRVYLEAVLDEPGHDYKCSECERPVFPFRHRKARYREVRCSWNRAGLLAYVANRVTGTMQVAPGCFRVTHDGSPMNVRVTELCDELERSQIDVQGNCPMLHVAIHSGSAGCPSAATSASVTLAELICEEVTLPAALTRALAAWRAGRPRSAGLMGAETVVKAGAISRLSPASAEPDKAVIREQVRRLKMMERCAIAALAERRVVGPDAPNMPGQELLAQWAGYSCDSSFKSSLSSLVKMRFLDNGRHHGRRGGYFLVKGEGERAAEILAQVMTSQD